jgi:hypothetical protein
MLLQTEPTPALILTESEVHAMSTAEQHVKLMCMWLYNDNIGGLFLTNNKQVSMWTKHVDIRALFIRELKNEGVLDVFYEKSEQLVPDLLSKNLALRLFDGHQRALQLGTMIVWREDVGDDRLRRLGFVQTDHVVGDGSPGVQTCRSLCVTRPAPNDVANHRDTNCDVRTDTDEWLDERKAKKDAGQRERAIWSNADD